MMKSNHAVISYYDDEVSSACVILVTSHIHIIKNAILVTVTVVTWSRK